MTDHIKEIEKYLECAYSGAKMMDDLDAMCRIGRALAALKADPELEIFTDQYKEIYAAME